MKSLLETTAFLPRFHSVADARALTGELCRPGAVEVADDAFDWESDAVAVPGHGFEPKVVVPAERQLPMP